MLILSKPFVLGSASPRRQEILRNAGFSFEVAIKPTDENYPIDIDPMDVPVFLAEQKLSEFDESYKDKIVLCADTVVILNGNILNKPMDEDEGISMLKSLSGKAHSVVTGVSFKTGSVQKSFHDVCKVHFNELTENEIHYYLQTCKPFDKAGAYGIQDFIGMVGIKALEGSFYTVMGLPIHLVYEHLNEYVQFDSR